MQEKASAADLPLRAMEVVRRQSSQSSCAASERIMALGGQAMPQEVVPLAPVDLDTAEKHMDKIENALRTIKERLAEIMKTCPLGALLPTSLAGAAFL